jgi:hypothetical protein
MDIKNSSKIILQRGLSKMMIIQLVLTSIILGIVYKKMLKWECDMSINKKQAFVPIFLGVLATMLTLVFALGIAFTFMNMGFTIENIQNVVIKSFVTSFWRAGLIEEISRLLMIILAIWLFKPKNVYEYILRHDIPHEIHKSLGTYEQHKNREYLRAQPRDRHPRSCPCDCSQHPFQRKYRRR